MNNALWTLQDILLATGGEPTEGLISHFNGLSIDSRTVGAGDLFLAIAGDVFDGHSFVQKALDAGAHGALVSKAKAQEHGFTQGVIVVENVEAAMADMARFARRRFLGQVVAVTGSVGKTTTKEMLKCACSALGKTHAAVASFNNHWGVPLTLARMPKDAAFAIIEIGMNHRAEIAPLVRMALPDVAVITSIESVHLEHFASLAGIADAKAEIFEGLGMGGVAVLPHAHSFYDRLKMHFGGSEAARIVDFGFDQGANCHPLGQQGVHLSANVVGHQVAFDIQAPGKHMISNAMAVLAVGHALGVSLQDFVRGLETFTPVKGRGTQTQYTLANGGQVVLIDESYNANPASMRAALQVLANAPKGMKGRRIAVLADMLELGEDSAKFHAQLAQVIDELNIDQAFVAGVHMKALFENLPESRQGLICEMAIDLLKPLLETLQDGDVLMLKGSHGSKLWMLADALAKALSQKEN